MEEMRKSLDMLLGVNRNLDKKEEEITNYTDKKLCKFDLCGLCPYKLFPNTKMDLGPCPFQICPVQDKYKQMYKRDKEKGKQFQFERDWENLLYSLVRKCDEKVDRKQKRIAVQASVQYQIPEELQKIQIELEKHTLEVQKLGDEGKVDEAQELMTKMELLKKEADLIESRMLPKTKEQKLIVCNVCAALLSEEESDQRLADHFAGKGHIGYQKIREALNEIEKQRRKHRDRDRGTRRRERDYYERERYERDFYGGGRRYDEPPFESEKRRRSYSDSRSKRMKY